MNGGRKKAQQVHCDKSLFREFLRTELTGPLFGMTPSQEAQYALDLALGPDHLKGGARAEYDRLAKLREYRAQHPEASPAPPPPGVELGGIGEPLPVRMKDLDPSERGRLALPATRLSRPAAAA